AVACFIPSTTSSAHSSASFYYHKSRMTEEFLFFYYKGLNSNNHSKIFPLDCGFYSKFPFYKDIFLNNCKNKKNPN
ncbi:hypothetical protein N9T61_02490, partial [Flavobacteriaceae bacterium]|nr:hypothetical protein [Flavobacteriaceae bacterium]